MIIDLFFAAVAAYGFYLGFKEGIIVTILNVLSIVFAVVGSVKFAPGMTRFLQTLTSSESPLMFLAGLISSFVLIMVFIRLLGKGVTGILETAHINLINQVAGGAFMSTLLILLYSVIIWFANQAQMLEPKTKAQSFTYRIVEPFPTYAKEVALLLKPTLQDFWSESMDMMDHLQSVSVKKTENDPRIYDIEDDSSSQPKQKDEENSAGR